MTLATSTWTSLGSGVSPVNQVICRFCGCALGGERYQHPKQKNALTPKTFSHIAKRSGGPQALATHNMSVSPTVC